MKTKISTNTKFETKQCIIRSFLDVKNIEKIEDKYSFKIIFQQMFLILTFISFVSLLIVSYTNGNESIKPTDASLNLSLRLCRSLFAIFMVWYLFFSIWSLKTGWDFIESNKKINGILFLLSFIPIFSLINIGIFVKYLNKSNWNYYKDLLFTQDSLLRYEYKWGNWRRYLLLGSSLVLLPIIVFVFFPDSVNLDPNKTYYNNIWFYSFNYFTIQANLMILFFTLTSLLFPGLKIFKNNNLHIILIVYIFIVCVAWNGLLLPANISSGKFAKLNTFQKTITFWYHLVSPIVFITCGLILIFKKRIKEHTEFKNIFKLGLIYPLMYLVFVGIVPFTAGISIYGNFTNVNPELGLLSGNKIVYGNYINFVIIIGFWFLFLFFIWLMWFIDKKVNNKNIN